MTVLRMAKRKLVLNLIPVAAPVARLGQIASLLEVADNSRNRSLRHPDHGRDVPKAGGWIAGDALEHVRVVGHEPPEMISLSCT
jgi:hypothetical protein